MLERSKCFVSQEFISRFVHVAMGAQGAELFQSES